eukprot:13886720-Ditylum_brightwellii.AAC.1
MYTVVRRVNVINKTPPYLKPGGKTLMVAQLNKHFTLKHLPGRLAVQYIAQGGEKLTVKANMKEKLEEIEDTNNLSKKINTVCKKEHLKLQNTKDKKKGNSKKDHKKPYTGEDHKEKGVNQRRQQMNGVYLATTISGRIARATPKVQMTKRVDTKVSFADIVGQYSSNKEFMMTSREDEVDNGSSNRIDDKTNNKTKDKQCKKSTGSQGSYSDSSRTRVPK